MSTNDYFEDIRAWPRRGHSLGVAYAVGFLLSLVLTFAAYFLVMSHAYTRGILVFLILALACIQFVVQVVCFLHISLERPSRERLAVLGGSAAVVLIIGIGSLWIMGHLDERMMGDSGAMEHYMASHQGI